MVVLSVGALAASAIAGDVFEMADPVGQKTDITNPVDPKTDIANPVDQKTLSVSVGADLTSAYFFRGYLQEDRGIIVQPWTELGVAIVQGADNAPDVSLTLGNWNSVHSKKTGATNTNAKELFESDFYTGITLEWQAFSLDAIYVVYTYPNRDFNTVQEIGVTAGFSPPDDTLFKKALGDISFGVHVEVNNSNVTTHEAIYAELGFGPSFDLFNEKATLSLPVVFGFSLDDYYLDPNGNDDFLGYASIGADVAIPLASGSYGDVTLNIGGNLLFLGSAAQAINRGEDFEVVGHIGLALSF